MGSYFSIPHTLVYTGILPITLGKGSEATGSRVRRDNGMKLCYTRNFAALHTHVGVTNGKHTVKLFYLYTGINNLNIFCIV